MGMIKLLCSGTWWFSSKKDSRWNIDGRSEVGMFAMPREAKETLEKLKKEYGEPPSDLEFGYEKD